MKAIVELFSILMSVVLGFALVSLLVFSLFQIFIQFN